MLTSLGTEVDQGILWLQTMSHLSITTPTKRKKKGSWHRKKNHSYVWQSAAPTCDSFRMVSQGVHEVTHGVQLLPQMAELLELWVVNKQLLSICIQAG